MARYKGFWIYVFGLCFSFIKVVPSRSSSHDRENTSLSGELGTILAVSELEDVTLRDKTTKNILDDDYADEFPGGEIDETEYALNPDDEDMNKTYQTFTEHLRKIAPDDMMPEFLAKYFYIRWTGIKYDPSMDVYYDENDQKPTLLGKSYYFGDVGTYKPGSKPAAFTKQELEKMHTLHNAKRRNVKIPAADMHYMFENNSLADMAQKLAFTCAYPRHTGIYKLTWPMNIGYNMYRGSSPDPTHVFNAWFSEGEDFDLVRWKCKEGKECGHYTQIIWGLTAALGCARHICWEEEREYLVVCLYYPPANIINTLDNEPERGYHVGKPCTLCQRIVGGWCYTNLCVPGYLCATSLKSCVCGLTDADCRNCGTKVPRYCECRCKTGWDFNDCSIRCGDAHRMCSEMPFQYCNSRILHVRRQMCRFQCEMCSVVTKDTPQSNTCCNDTVCPRGQEPNKKTCKCQNYSPTLWNYLPTEIPVTTGAPTTTPEPSGSLSVFAFQSCLGLLLAFLVAKHLI